MEVQRQLWQSAYQIW